MCFSVLHPHGCQGSSRCWRMVVFPRRMVIFPEVTNHRVPPPADGGAPECSTSPSGAQESPSLECLDLGRKRVMCTYLWWWRVRSSVCREAVMGTQERGPWAPSDPALLEVIGAWCKLPWPGEPLLLFASILLFACIVVSCKQRILIDTKDTSELELQEN